MFHKTGARTTPEEHTADQGANQGADQGADQGEFDPGGLRYVGLHVPSDIPDQVDRVR